MNSNYKDFIGFYRGCFPKGYCEHLIKEFDRLQANGVGCNRQDSGDAQRHIKDDHLIFINFKNHSLLKFEGQDPSDIFFDGLQECYNEYSAKYSVLTSCGNIRGTSMKMQKTSPGGGYHVWHCEQGSGGNSARVVTYMLYLNTLQDNENGETEFLYQQQRVRTEENLMLLWPAAYTHAHRGNPVYGNNSKYIVTGWFLID